MGPFRRYIVTMVVVLLVLQSANGLLEGQGLAAFVGAGFAFIWLGWLVVLAGLPLFIALLWAQPRVYRRFSTRMPRLSSGLRLGSRSGRWLRLSLAASPPPVRPPPRGPTWVIR